MHVIGTAGHVDHGKSALVRALTGTEPDRWLEERLRGMTLDLGFARLHFDDGVEAGIVDVPGHERFLHNMLAGAAGMEVLMLVVAANEGVKPQTLEHLEILQYLNVTQTLVVLTKSDLVDPQALAFTREVVREQLAGTCAAGAQYFAVSSVNGAGIDALRGALHALLDALPARAPEAPAYLPIDRVFALPGHGTIVTGTLMQGRIAVGDRLALTPPGRDVRVRGLQVFGEKRERVAGGSRVAVNVPGVETHEIARGAVLASAQFAARAHAAVTFRPAPAALGLFKRRTPVRAYLGAAEILGTLVFESVPNDGRAGAARLRLRTPTIVVPGAAFVVRGLSPKTLLGGGTIAGYAGTAETPAEAEAPETSAVRAALWAAGLAGTTATEAGAAANLREDGAAALLENLLDTGLAWRLSKPAAFVDAALAAEAFERARERLAASECESPWLAGLTCLALARSLEIAEVTLARILAAAAADGLLVYRDGYYATPDFAPALSPEQRALFERLFDAAVDGCTPVPYADVRQAMRSASVAGVAQAFETLLVTRALVKVQDAVYRGDQLQRVRAKLEAALRRDKQITMSAFRDLAGTSRKFAVPLLEWFDASGVTIRSGDVRLLRVSAPPDAPRSLVP